MAGRYRCGRVLGSGATSTVFEGRDLSTGQAVAIKRIVAEVSAHRDGGDLLRREVGVSERVRHPGLVKVYDAGRDPDGSFFIIMEFLSGATFEEHLDGGSVSLEQGLDVVEAVLDPLAALHAHGVVHRDLKPSNIFLTEDGEVKLLDLGIAKHAHDASVTKTGAGVGTPHYMAPEQAVSARDVKPVADVWSVGALLYRLVAGRLPFEGANAYEVVLKACTEEPRPVMDWAPRADPLLAALIHGCLVKAPEYRIADAAALLEALREVRAGTYRLGAALADPALAALARAATELPQGGDDATDRAYRSIELPRSRAPLYLGLFLSLAALGTGAGALIWAVSEPSAVAPIPAPPAIPAARPAVEDALPIEPAETVERIEPRAVEAAVLPDVEARSIAPTRARSSAEGTPSVETSAPSGPAPRSTVGEGRRVRSAANGAGKTRSGDAAAGARSESGDAEAGGIEPGDASSDARSASGDSVSTEGSESGDAASAAMPDTPPITATPPSPPKDAGVRPPAVATPPPPVKKKKKTPTPFLTF